MTRKEDIYDYDDMIQRCFSLLESNFAVFVDYTKFIEELRLKIITPNEEYRILKSWLHAAYNDIINLKFENTDLIRLYKVLLNNNFVQEFYDYVNDRKTSQLKFIQIMNESKNLEIKLNAVKEDITSLKTKYTSDEETLRLKFIDIISECKRLKSRLDSAYEEIILSNLEYDMMSKSYRKLLMENTVKEFLDCAKNLEILRLEFNPTNDKCTTESCLNQTNEAIVSLQSKLDEVRKILKGKRLKCEKIKGERDSLNFLLEKLCRLLNKTPGPVEINQECILVDKSIRSSANELEVGIADNNDELVFIEVDMPVLREETCMSSEANNERDTIIQDQVLSELTNEPNSLSKASKCTISAAKSNKSFLKKRRSVRKSSAQLVLCEKCGKSFSVKNSEQGQTPLKCPTCNKPPKPSCVRCDICGRTYSQKSSLTFHIRRIHEGKIDFQCAICGKQFNVKSSLKSHELSHESEKPYKCSTCNRCFRHRSNWKRHIRIVHEKHTPFWCAHCDRKCGVKSELSYHIQTKHFSGMLKQFKCTMCDKAFAYRHDLTRHESLHAPWKSSK